MANVLNKDPFTYAEDRRSFLQDLQRFHTSRGTPFDRIPQIGGREIDLYRLYRRVIDMGGWQKVNTDLLWEDIQEEFKVPLACVNGSQALKHIYFRYLNIYEKVHFLGVDPDNSGDDQEDGPARKKVCLPVESVPLTYNYNHHKLQDIQRKTCRLSTDLARFSDYEKLEMSLRSGLANEVDFAVNVCLLLSNEGRHVLKLAKSLHLLPLLMANIGIFEEGPGTMEDVMAHCWSTGDSKRDFFRFWYDTVKDEEIRENLKTRKGINKREEMLGSEVLHLGRELGVRDAEGQRVTQLAMLIRNLSFEDVNQQLLASSTLVFRFLMLCVHSSYGSLRQLALDTLGNLATQMVLQPVETTTTQLIMNLIKKSLVEEDKFIIVRALEMLSKLCQLEKNEAILSECLEGETYSRIVQLLTVHDIQLIVHTLEALYQLSELGETTTTMIANVKNAVDLLVNLITVEAQSYGPNSLIGIKVVEYVPPPDPNATPSSSSPAMPQPSRTVIQSVAPNQTLGFSVQQSTQLSTVDQARVDVETTTSNWLQGTFEVKKGCCISHADLFADYQQFCHKFGVADTLTSTDFSSIVKSAIPQVSVTEVDKGGGEKEPVFRGLCRRAIPRPFAILAGSDRVSKSSSYSVPVSSLRGPVPANWSLTSDPLVASPTHTPTLRQRLMEPPRMSLQQQLLNHAGATGAGAPPSTRAATPSSKPQALAPKPSPGGVKKRPVPTAPPPAQPSGPGPGSASPRPVQMSARPVLMAGVSHQRPVVSALQQQLQVAGTPQPGTSMLHSSTGDHIVIQSSSSPLSKPNGMLQTANNSNCTSTQVPLSSPLVVSTSVALPAAPPLTSVASTSPGQQFPLIHQALQGDAAASGGKQCVAIGEQGNDTNLIKSLLAKKVCQNMVRQGNTTPSQSPPPVEFSPDSPTTATELPSQQHQTQQDQLQPPTGQLRAQHQYVQAVQHQQTTYLPPLQQQSQQLHIQSQIHQQTAQSHQQQHIQPQVQPSQLLQQTQVVPQTQIVQSTIVQQPQVMPQPQVIQQSQLMQQPQVIQHAQVVQQSHPGQTQQAVVQNHLQVHLQQQHGQPQVLQAQPHLQQVLHLQHGQQVLLHQQPAQQQPQQIHIQQRVSGQQQTLQQIVLQGNPQQQVHLRPQQQIILQQHLQQHQQHVVIQGQPTLQQILHQPVQQLHIQPSQQLQIQGQGQPLRIQTQSQQPVVIQLPVYQLSQMTNTQMASVCVPTTLVQTTSGGLSQTTVMPYRTIIPHPSVSLSSQRGHMPESGSSIGQFATANKQDQDIDMAGGAGDLVSSDNAKMLIQHSMRAQGNGGSALQSALLTPSQPSEAVASDSNRLVAQPLRDTLSAQGIVPSIPAAPAVQTLFSPGLLTSRTPSAASSFSSSSVLPHPSASSSFSCSSSQTPSLQRMPMLQSTMSITQAILSGHDIRKAKGNHPHTIWPPVESHTQTLKDSGHVNGNNNLTMPSNKECNGLSEANKVDLLPQNRGEVNGILGSPDSVTSDLPPSPMEGVKVNQERIPNGLIESNVNSLKECALHRSKEFLHSLTEKANRINGIVRHPENGDIKVNFSQNKIEVQQEWRVPQAGEKVQIEGGNMEVDSDKKIDLWHVNGLSGHSGTKENHTSSIPLPHRDREQVFVKQTSMEEVSLDSTDIKLVNGSRSDSGGRPLFSPDGSHDSDLSCDSFASSIADSVSSDKHSSLTPHQFSRPSTITQSSSSSHVFPEVPLVLAGTVPMSEAANKRSKKKSTAKPKSERAPAKSNSKKRKSNSGSSSGLEASASAAAGPLVMEYMCEWAGCGRCFNSARLVFIHVTKTHVPVTPESLCQWHGCEPLRRKKWSLVTHLQDHHCSEAAQRAGCHRRMQAAQAAATTSQTSTSVQQAPALVYPPDAAMQAIKRFHIKPPFAEFAEQREGPVTKHIRLTSALILRNLARYSSHGRSLIKHWERQLSYVTMSAVESSTALSNCLWEILHDT